MEPSNPTLFRVHVISDLWILLGVCFTASAGPATRISKVASDWRGGCREPWFLSSQGDHVAAYMNWGVLFVGVLIYYAPMVWTG